MKSSARTSKIARRRITATKLPAGERPDQHKARANHHKDGKCLTEEQDILKRWSEYCSQSCYRATGDPEVLNVPPATDNDNVNYPILREEVETAVKSLKKGKSAGADNIPT